MRRSVACCAIAFGLVLSSLHAVHAQTDDLGFPTQYLVLGPFANPGGCCPGPDGIQRDFLCNDEVNEDSIEPFEGLIVGAPSGDCSDSQFLGSLCDGDPVVQVLSAVNTTLDLNTLFSPNDNTMAYLWVYVVNLTDDNVEGTIGVGTDDSVQIKINGNEVHLNNIGRGCGGPGTVQDDGISVLLEPGPNLVQLKVFEGGGGWCARLRLLDDQGQPITNDGERFLVTTSPTSESDSRATRAITLGAGTADVELDVAVTEGTVTVSEEFHPSWRVTQASAGAIVDDERGEVSWENQSTGILSYRLERDDPCSPDQGEITGRVGSGEDVTTTTGESLIPSCDAPGFVEEFLATPAYDLGESPCAYDFARLTGTWLSGITDLDDEFTDETFVPDAALEFAQDFESVGTIGYSPIGVGAQDLFWTDPGEPDFTQSRVVPVLTTSLEGFVDWNTHYGGLVENTMNVASFYVVNLSDEVECAFLGFRSDDAAVVRLNGHPIHVTPGCRGHGNQFSDKFRARLDPGKNLISMYTFQGGGGYGTCIRFEDAQGRGIYRETTIDPTGYDPADHEPSFGCQLGGGDDDSKVSPLGFVMEYLVPARPLSNPTGCASLPTPRAEDYIGVVTEAGTEPVSATNIAEGTVVGASDTGTIAMSI
ncbi:MAG: hypothetical protein AAF488_18725, partial [Planctomycetota bacterium]